MCESGSDSGSSSGSVRASRGSWGSWSSASSMEGDRDPNARIHACTTSSRKSKECLFSLSRKTKILTYYYGICINRFLPCFSSHRGLHVRHLPSRTRLLPDQYKQQGSKVSQQTQTLLDTRTGSDCMSLHRSVLVS